MIKGAVLALILLTSSPACGQYVRNGELVDQAPPEDADRERLILVGESVNTTTTSGVVLSACGSRRKRSQ